jgi:hypothetical protein
MDWHAILGFLVGCLTTVFPFYKWRIERKDKKREVQEKLQERAEKMQEREERKKAEAELAAVSRRAFDAAPYFAVSDRRFDLIEFPSDNPRKNFRLAPWEPSMLSFMHTEVDRTIPDGEQILLLIEERGSPAEEIKILLDGNPASLVYGLFDRRQSQLPAIQYAYRPQCHGKEQTFEISFLASNGVRDTHRYATRHGFRELRRIDPA